MNKKTIVAIAACAISLAACNAPQKAMLEGMDGEWNITEVDGSKLATASGQTPYIGFDLKEGRIYGFSGCNRIMASIDEKTGMPNFGHMGSTMMACPDMETERKVLAAMGKVASVKKGADGTVALLDADGKSVATLEKRFEPMEYAALEGEWMVAKVNGAAVKPAEGMAQPVLSFDTKANRLGGNAGCNRVMGNIEQGKSGPLSISFGQVATTRMACPDMETERNVLAALSDVKTFGQLPGGNVALFNGSGMITIELEKAKK